MRSTFRILFYINRSKQKNGMVPIMGRITLNGTVSQFSCKLNVFEPFWDVSSHKAVFKSEYYERNYTTIDEAKIDIEETNAQLDVIRAKIVATYQSLLFVCDTLTANKIKEKTFGLSNEYETLLQSTDKDIMEYLPRVNKDRSALTYRKMKIVRKHLHHFIMKTYRTPDIYMVDLKSDFLRKFYNYIIDTKHLKHSTAWVYCCYLKKIALKAYSQGSINHNPFFNFKLPSSTSTREYLTENELNALIEHHSADPISELVRDLFVFSCFTGISFIDIMALGPKNIITTNDEIWVVGHRKKSMVPFHIRLMDVPRAILLKHWRHSNKNIFQPVTNNVANKKLKIIIKQCHINKNITFHCARHTFATLALTYGMPIESVSKILGHTSITTTQIYAKITNLKIGLDIDCLEKAIDGKFSNFTK